MARGGKNYPRDPAPVSGPGAASRRTDGGAGSATQPIREIPGQAYGQGKAFVEQQQGAPLASSPAPAASASSARGVPPAGAGAPAGVGGVFGPTQRPAESPLAGMNTRGNAIAQDVDTFIRILYSQFHHPGIAMLLRKDM